MVHGTGVKDTESYGKQDFHSTMYQSRNIYCRVLTLYVLLTLCPCSLFCRFYASREQLINKLNVQCMFYKLYKKNLCLMFKGEKRVIEMDGKFFPGYRKTILKPEEILLSIEIPYTRKVCI